MNHNNFTVLSVKTVQNDFNLTSQAIMKVFCVHQTATPTNVPNCIAQNALKTCKKLHLDLNSHETLQLASKNASQQSQVSHEVHSAAERHRRMLLCMVSSHANEGTNAEERI